jgi:hypothetical protein
MYQLLEFNAVVIFSTRRSELQITGAWSVGDVTAEAHSAVFQSPRRHGKSIVVSDMARGQ